MALKILDTLKKIDIGKASEVASEVSDAFSGVFSRNKKSGEQIEPQAQPEPVVEPVVEAEAGMEPTPVAPAAATSAVESIETVDSLNDYLTKLQVGAPPAVMSALGSQLQVLKYVQSPTLTLMAVDNIMLCLYRSLVAAETEEQKATLRDIYSSLDRKSVV